MIGCLGGLGRSLSRWMLGRGARQFTFLGRSATDKSSSRLLVQDLRDAGAEVSIVRGDVTNLHDVEAAVAASSRPIGGVVHAAMGLSVRSIGFPEEAQGTWLMNKQESLFTSMTLDSWQTCLNPKIRGTWNLHNALKEREGELDFFLLTSSLSGSIGQPTESNYCAANSFLDYFARYRRRLGLPATAIGFGAIREIGYLDENPEIEAMFARKGIALLSEDDVLQIIDIALCEPPASANWEHTFAQGHILSGIEVTGSDAKRAMDGGISPFLNDARASIVTKGISGDKSTSSTGRAQSKLPTEIEAALNSQDSKTLTEAICAGLAKKLATLIMVPAESIPTQKSFSNFGMDSMLAAEYRTFVFQTFDVDISFTTLMDALTDLTRLTSLVQEKLEASRD